jgi:hypothetical protein
MLEEEAKNAQLLDIQAKAMLAHTGLVLDSSSLSIGKGVSTGFGSGGLKRNRSEASGVEDSRWNSIIPDHSHDRAKYEARVEESGSEDLFTVSLKDQVEVEKSTGLGKWESVVIKPLREAKVPVQLSETKETEKTRNNEVKRRHESESVHDDEDILEEYEAALSSRDSVKQEDCTSDSIQVVFKKRKNKK